MVKFCVTANGTRTLLLIICSISYLLVGAAVFSALEYDEYQKRRVKMEKDIVEFRSKYNVTAEDFGKWAEFMQSQKATKVNVESWSFAGSVYFATTVITTIGKLCLN